jgi:hypothetical protein
MADDALWLALAGLDPDDQFSRWWAELRAMHEQDGMSPDRARHVAYRQARVAELIADDWEDEAILARVGCAPRTLCDDRGAIERMLRASGRVRLEATAA